MSSGNSQKIVDQTEIKQEDTKVSIDKTVKKAVVKTLKKIKIFNK